MASARLDSAHDASISITIEETMSVDVENMEVVSESSNSKRRRLNGYATPASLKKPFKSPFRIAQPSQHDVQPNDEDATSNDSGSTVRAASSALDTYNITSGSPRYQAKPLRTYTPSPLNKPQKHSKPIDPEKPDTINAIANAKRTQSSLITQVSQTRQDIDALKQAISLASSTKDEELSELIDKWTAAARLAAEEVFGTCKDKVNKMGGVGAWRERELQQREWQKQWDEPLPDAGGNTEHSEDDEEAEGAEAEAMGDMGKEERRALREARRELRTQERDLRDRCNKPDDAGEENEMQRDSATVQGHDDDTFTMDMMLNILNIDLNTIGYSKDRQMWVG